MSRNLALADFLVRADIWRGDACPDIEGQSVTTGHPLLDAELPGGGWPRGTLTELLVERNASVELTLLLPALRQAVYPDGRLALIAPPYPAYAPAWLAAGMDLRQLLIVSAESRDAAWGCEQILASGALAAVLRGSSRQSIATPHRHASSRPGACAASAISCGSRVPA